MPAGATPNDERAREVQAVAESIAGRLRGRGVTLDGEESPDELVQLLEAVERFEHAVEAQGGDLMVDEGPGGVTTEPDDPHFVLPRRPADESVSGYLDRIDGATELVRNHRPHGS